MVVELLEEPNDKLLFETDSVGALPAWEILTRRVLLPAFMSK
jgi:hypothetical protein